MKILHIIPAEKFTADFIAFIRRHFNDEEHFFLTFEDIASYPYEKNNDTLHLKSKRHLSYAAFKHINSADKIILHGTLVSQFLSLLIQPWAYKKCYWVIWGADLYNDLKANESIRNRLKYFLNKIINPQLKGLITYIKGDRDLASDLYKTKYIYHECLVYLSNVYIVNNISKKSGVDKNILVGNSACSNNNHEEAFNILLPYKEENICIYSILSYGGSQEYVEYIVRLGRDMFGDKFIPILDFWPKEKYMDLLSQIDIAIFMHKRQQAMGNTIALLGMGKKVYMRDDISSASFFAEKGIKVFASNVFNLEDLEHDVVQENKKRIFSYFSEENLINQWSAIFKD